jgi:hypothetical protein
MSYLLNGISNGKRMGKTVNTSQVAVKWYQLRLHHFISAWVERQRDLGVSHTYPWPIGFPLGTTHPLPFHPSKSRSLRIRIPRKRKAVRASPSYFSPWISFR